jgi:hypothetical protein
VAHAADLTGRVGESSRKHVRQAILDKRRNNSEMWMRHCRESGFTLGLFDDRAKWGTCLLGIWKPERKKRKEERRRKKQEERSRKRKPITAGPRSAHQTTVIQQYSETPVRGEPQSSDSQAFWRWQHLCLRYRNLLPILNNPPPWPHTGCARNQAKRKKNPKENCPYLTPKAV